MIKINLRDYVWLLLVGGLAFFVFINAQEDFSYDYIHYMNYFNALGGVSFGTLVEGIYDSFPIPYVVIPPSGSFEIGFGFFAWSLMQIFENESLVYAIIACISITVRFWVLRKIGVSWGWIIAVNVYAITLFEANAIRLGCSVTLFLCGLLLIYQGRSLFFAILIFIAAGLFHLQIFFEVFLFLFVYFFAEFIAGSKIRLMIYISTVIFGVVILRIFTNYLGFGKYADYLNIKSLAGGLNVVTVLGLLVVLIFLIKIFMVSEDVYKDIIVLNEVRVWFSVAMVIVPALAIYIFINNMGALGDRIWQMTFVIFSFNAGTKVWKRKIGGVGTVFLSLLILVANINVIYRYPLSNFFYPFVEYIEIDSSFPIL